MAPTCWNQSSVTRLTEVLKSGSTHFLSVGWPRVTNPRLDIGPSSRMPATILPASGVASPVRPQIAPLGGRRGSPDFAGTGRPSFERSTKAGRWCRCPTGSDFRRPAVVVVDDDDVPVGGPDVGKRRGGADRPQDHPQANASSIIETRVAFGSGSNSVRRETCTKRISLGCAYAKSAIWSTTSLGGRSAQSMFDVDLAVRLVTESQVWVTDSIGELLRQTLALSLPQAAAMRLSR